MMSSAQLRERQGEDRLDRVFSALGHRARRALFARLARGPAKVTELAEPFDMSLPAVSRHLRVLEKAGLVRRHVEGRVHRCTLRAEPLAELQQWLSHYRPFWQQTLESLAGFVEKEDEEDA